MDIQDITLNETRVVYNDMTGIVACFSNTRKSCWFSPDNIQIGLNVPFYLLKQYAPDTLQENN
jgi:hypothetical protein